MRRALRPHACFDGVNEGRRHAGRKSNNSRGGGKSMSDRPCRIVRVLVASVVLCACVALLGQAASTAETWKFYMHQSAPNFATSRGAKMLTEEIEKATSGELKMQ